MKDEKASGSWDEKLRWEYEWNPRDQMETAIKVENDSANHSGRVEYRYCLSCDGALSERIEREAGSGEYTPIVSWQRYEYHGLDLLRVDERYDSNTSGTITSADAWRTLEVSTHRPGAAVGSLLGKRVYTHTNNDATPDDTDDFYYTYDPVGNVVSVVDDSGNEAYHFTQEAFGNELPVNVLGGSDWDDAADDRIVEHQTGKWMDEFTGLFYFWARWYEPEVGRFVSRDPIRRKQKSSYAFCSNLPTRLVDPAGLADWPPDAKPCCSDQVDDIKERLAKINFAISFVCDRGIMPPGLSERDWIHRTSCQWYSCPSTETNWPAYNALKGCAQECANCGEDVVRKYMDKNGFPGNWDDLFELECNVLKEQRKCLNGYLGAFGHQGGPI